MQYQLKEQLHAVRSPVATSAFISKPEVVDLVCCSIIGRSSRLFMPDTREEEVEKAKLRGAGTSNGG